MSSDQPTVGPPRRSMGGFSLIELLVVVTIIALLAAVGVPMYQDYLVGVQEEDAKQGLSSIYLMQEQYKATEGNYYTGSGGTCCSAQTSADLTQILFGGTQSLNEDYYWYAVEQKGANGFVAHARKHNGSGQLCIDNNNTKSWKDSSTGAPPNC